MQETGLKVMLKSGAWFLLVLPADMVRATITSWMNGQMQEFHTLTCQLSGSAYAFRPAEVEVMHTFDPGELRKAQAQQPQANLYRQFQNRSGN